MDSLSSSCLRELNPWPEVVASAVGHEQALAVEGRLATRQTLSLPPLFIFTSYTPAGKSDDIAMAESPPSINLTKRKAANQGDSDLEDSDMRDLSFRDGTTEVPFNHSRLLPDD